MSLADGGHGVGVAAAAAALIRAELIGQRELEQTKQEGARAYHLHLRSKKIFPLRAAEPRR